MKQLTLVQYQPLARRTMKEMPFAAHLEHMGLGITGEFGEFIDAIKKFFVHGKGVDPKDRMKDLKVADGGVLDTVNLSEEGADAWWYVVGDAKELDVSMTALQAAFDEGVRWAKEWTRGPNKLVLQCNSQVAAAVAAITQDDMPTESVRLNGMQIIARNLGMLYGYFDLDLGTSLALNIAKLAERYGDKYSDEGGLVRDLIKERQILTGKVVKVVKPLGEIIGAPLTGTGNA
jgi:NTP pyrophosphatase (non-canonical NTP hydrolase)